MADLRALDRQVLDVTVRIVADVTPDQLDRPTPCAEWNLGELLRHMVAHNNGFAAAARGLPAAPAVWDGDQLAADPATAFAASAARVTEAFGAADLLDGRMEVHGYGVLPARTALGMHLIDYLAHGWDVARAIGQHPRLDEEACLATLRIAAGWPVGSPAIWGPGAPFAPPVDVPPDAPADHRVLGLLGRSPHWPD